RGAAADGVEERGLHLEEAALVEEAAEGLHDGGARPEGLGDLGVREEIDVTLAVALLDVLEAVPLGGRREHRLGHVAIAIGAEGEGAGLRLDGGAFDEDVIGEVELLELRGALW